MNPHCNPSVMPETNTRSLTQTLTKTRARYEFVLSGSIDEVGRPKLEAIVAHLQKVTGDTSLTLLDVESGSIKLVLEGVEESFQMLESLIASGELDEVLGIPVQGINRREPESSQQVSITGMHLEPYGRVTRSLMKILPTGKEEDPREVKATVFDSIPANGIGYVKFQGSIWRAYCKYQITLEAGTSVRVIDRENLTLTVEPLPS